MSQANKNKLLALSIVALSVGIFFVSFFIAQNGVFRSLFGSLFMLFIGCLGFVLEYKTTLEERSLWTKTIVKLAVTNGLFLILWLVVFPENLLYYLVFAITYTAMSLLSTSMTLKIDRMGSS